MFSPTVIQRSVSRYCDHVRAETGNLDFSLTRHDPGHVADWIDHLSSAYGDDGIPTRDLTPEESSFIRNERVLGALDFRYWRDRYAWMHRDSNIHPGGGVGPSPPMESQKLLFERIAQVQDANHELIRSGLPSPGIKIADHKARQLGHTQSARELSMHALTTSRAVRSLAASIGEDEIGELWDRDELLLNNLPPWLRPSLSPGSYFSNIRERRLWKTLNSRITYQMDGQMSGLGQGRQFERCHLTEVASFLYPLKIKNDLIPTLEHPKAVAVFESTAQGRGNWWHEFVEAVRAGKAPGWVFHFTPWYVETRKYRANPPADWSPLPMTLLHAEQCERTSPEFCFGKTIRPTKEQLYWYETNRESAAADRTLNFFLANYCATPEESFQHTNRSSFSFETLDMIRKRARPGVPYAPDFYGTVGEERVN